MLYKGDRNFYHFDNQDNTHRKFKVALNPMQFFVLFFFLPERLCPRIETTRFFLLKNYPL